MSDFDYDVYLDRQVDEHTRDKSNDEEEYDRWEEAMCDKADAQRELDREED